jgi:hypothetical protein
LAVDVFSAAATHRWALVFPCFFNFRSLSCPQTKPIKAATMKKLLIFVTLLTTLAPALPGQEKGLIKNPDWYRIVNGRGAGSILYGNGSSISGGLNVTAGGFIAVGHFNDCECDGFYGHYHGSLSFAGDPAPNGCGWGCVLQAANSYGQAASRLQDQINLVGMTSPGLAAKLGDILDEMDFASYTGCYSVLEALADAFEEEVYAYFGVFGENTSFDPLFGALCEYVNWAEYDMELPYDYIPSFKPNTIKILARYGSGMTSFLRDPGLKINARIGSVVSLEGFGPDVSFYRWEYKWKGAEEGENPSGCSLSYLDNHLTATSQKQTSVRITGWGMLPDQRLVKDTAIINFSRLNF